MTSVATERLLSRDDLLARAPEGGELAWSRREKTDQARRLPDDIIKSRHESGLLRLTNQKRWGSADADRSTVLDVGRELSRGSGALGWIYTLSSFHTWYMAFTSEELQHEVYESNPDALVADSFAPVRQIERVSGGYLRQANGGSPAVSSGRPGSRSVASFPLRMADLPGRRCSSCRARKSPFATIGSRSGCAGRRAGPSSLTGCSFPNTAHTFSGSWRAQDPADRSPNKAQCGASR